MSAEISTSLQKWGGPRHLWRRVLLLRNKTFEPPHGPDHPDLCCLGSDYWIHYPLRDYQYRYNDWGFRDSLNFEPLRKENTDQKVNICIGDSFTLNYGGPAGHSWPAQLSTMFNQPTVNCSLNSLSSDYYSSCVRKFQTLFNVDKVFVLFNFFDDRDSHDKNLIKSLTPKSEDIRQKLLFLKNHCYIPEAIYQFTPPWTITDEELKVLYEIFPRAHDFMEYFRPDWSALDYESAVSCQILYDTYLNIAGKDWIPYTDFVKEMIVDPRNIMRFYRNPVDQRLIRAYITNWFVQLLTRNRDGWHMGKQMNLALAKYFYQKSTNIPAPFV